MSRNHSTMLILSRFVARSGQYSIAWWSSIASTSVVLTGEMEQSENKIHTWLESNDHRNDVVGLVVWGVLWSRRGWRIDNGNSDTGGTQDIGCLTSQLLLLGSTMVSVHTTAALLVWFWIGEMGQR